MSAHLERQQEHEQPQTTQEHGESMSFPTDVLDFTQPETAQALLEQLNEAVSNVHVRRSAGTYIHDFAMGLLSYEGVLQVFIDNPETVHICIDEHCTKPDYAAGVGVTSHAGCGAAAVVHGMMVSGSDAGRMQALFGEAGDLAGKVRSGVVTPDALGQLWSQKLVADLRARGVDAVHTHLGVERYALAAHDDEAGQEESHEPHLIHSATAAVISVRPDQQENFVSGMPGEKPFMVSNLRSGESSPMALQVMAKEAVLAAMIAFGGHGILHSYSEKKFALLVTQADEAFPRSAFEEQIAAFCAQFGVDQSRLQLQYAA